MLSYLNVNNIITPSKSGFMPGDSTVNELALIYHDLCTSFERGTTTQSPFVSHFQGLRFRMWHKGIIEKKKKKKKKKETTTTTKSSW